MHRGLNLQDWVLSSFLVTSEYEDHRLGNISLAFFFKKKKGRVFLHSDDIEYIENKLV